MKSNDLENEGLKFLDEQDKLYGKNLDAEAAQPEVLPESKKVTSLGKATTPMLESTIGGSNDLFWKNVPFETLPSQGLFYPENSEITIKAATVSEIRQWSTIDDGDMLDIDDKLNFVIEKCCRFKVKGGESWLTWRDISELDRLALIFMIQEMTFPKDQNTLYVKFECNADCEAESKWRDDVKVRSSMLKFIELPTDVMKYYSSQYKCFEVVSEKLNETFYLYMPTIGVIERLRARIAESRKQGRTPDKAFISLSPYIVQDWQNLTQQSFSDLSKSSYGWHINKFTFIKKFTELIEDARFSMVGMTCPKCGGRITTPLFQKSGFTVKDLFLISGGLDELI
jgi:hypothetical protein